MTEPTLVKKEEYARSVCFFLAELLRTRKITLKRSAEIAQKMVDHINLIDNEQDFLKLIKELTYDFEELFQLEQRVTMHMHSTQREAMEGVVREFVVSIMARDTQLALSVLLEAIKDNAQINDLMIKFPQLKEFAEIKK